MASAELMTPPRRVATELKSMDPVTSVAGNGNGRGRQIENNELLTDTTNLFMHNMDWGMAVWAYLNGGRKYLEAFFESPNYDGSKEIDLIPVLAKQFARNLPSRISLIEVGPGKAFRTKTIAFVNALNDFNRAAGNDKTIVEYYGLDIVSEYAEISAKFMQDKYKIPGYSLNTNIMELQSRPKFLGTPVAISWNSPIWNSPKPPHMGIDFVLANSLAQMGKLVGPQGIAILTHFPLGNLETTKNIYKDPNCEKAVMAIPSLVEARLKPLCTPLADSKEDIDLEDVFDYEVDIDPENETINMNLVCKQDIKIKIGKFQAIIHANERFSPAGSAKPSIERFNRIAGIAGASVINTAQLGAGDVVGHALKFPKLAA